MLDLRLDKKWEYGYGAPCIHYENTSRNTCVHCEEGFMYHYKLGDVSLKNEDFHELMKEAEELGLPVICNPVFPKKGYYRVVQLQDKFKYEFKGDNNEYEYIISKYIYVLEHRAKEKGLPWGGGISDEIMFYKLEQLNEIDKLREKRGYNIPLDAYDI